MFKQWNPCLGERSEGSREDIIEYMESMFRGEK